MSSEVQGASAVTSDMLSSNGNVVVDFDCQLDWIWNLLGDTALDASVRVCPERLN